MAIIEFPILYIPDPVKGRPLGNGQIFVGDPDTDPQLPGDQKQLNIVRGNGTIVPVNQPFFLSFGGVPVDPDNAGVPVRLDVDGNYSIKILDKDGQQAYYINNVFEGQPVLVGDLPQYVSAEFATVNSMINADSINFGDVDWDAYEGRIVNTTVHNTLSNEGGMPYIITKTNPGNLSSLVSGIWEGVNHDLGGGNYAKLKLDGETIPAAALGAVADGVRPTQSAINSATTNGLQVELKGNNTVYAIDGTITLGSRAGIIGEQDNFYNSVIRVVDDSFTGNIIQTDGFGSQDVDFVILKNVSIQHNLLDAEANWTNAQVNPESLSFVTDFVTGGRGINIQGTAFVIQNVAVVRTPGVGVFLTATSSSGNHIIDNLVTFSNAQEGYIQAAPDGGGTGVLDMQIDKMTIGRTWNSLNDPDLSRVIESVVPGLFFTDGCVFQDGSCEVAEMHSYGCDIGYAVSTRGGSGNSFRFRVKQLIGESSAAGFFANDVDNCVVTHLDCHSWVPYTGRDLAAVHINSFSNCVINGGEIKNDTAAGTPRGNIQLLVDGDRTNISGVRIWNTVPSPNGGGTGVRITGEGHNIEDLSIYNFTGNNIDGNPSYGLFLESGLTASYLDIKINNCQRGMFKDAGITDPGTLNVTCVNLIEPTNDFDNLANLTDSALMRGLLLNYGTGRTNKDSYASSVLTSTEGDGTDRTVNIPIDNVKNIGASRAQLSISGDISSTQKLNVMSITQSQITVAYNINSANNFNINASIQ